jgi:diacylglycerol kinase (ATP)
MGTRIIVNPQAGAGRAAARARAVAPQLHAAWPGLEWVESTSAEHVTQLAREANQAGYERVIVVGGDGTVHLAVNGLVGGPTALGVLPAGSGNDLLSALGFPPDLEATIRLLERGQPRQIDVGLAHGRAFCCVLGVGLDTAALRIVHQSRFRRGRGLYTYAALRTLLTYSPRPMRIRYGSDGAFEGEVTFAAVSNTPTYAGGMRIAPRASVADGQLDLCVVPRLGRARMLASFGRMTRGRHGDMAGIVLAQSASFHLESDDPIPVTLDGELTELSTPLEARIVPGGLTVIAPPAVPGR